MLPDRVRLLHMQARRRDWYYQQQREAVQSVRFGTSGSTPCRVDASVPPGEIRVVQGNCIVGRIVGLAP